MGGRFVVLALLAACAGGPEDTRGTAAFPSDFLVPAPGDSGLSAGGSGLAAPSDTYDTTPADTAPPPPVDTDGSSDLDGDGYPTPADCDDRNAAVHPGAQEVCDARNVDEDCDGLADDADDSATGKIVYRPDADADGYGAVDPAIASCDAPAGWVTRAGDCDDTRADVHRGATEVYGDGVDEDCDGREICYFDLDDDGWRSTATATIVSADADCDDTGEALATEPWGDCTDSNPAVNPDATEVCNGLDDDCDGAIDGPGTPGTATWYADADADGHGDPAAAVVSCSPPIGAVALGDDCDDRRASVHPGAPETCDGLDDDCDGAVDEPDAVDAPSWYVDADADGFGGTATVRACVAPPGTAGRSGDCDDRRADVSPAAVEVCDGVDDDCDGLVDEPDAADAALWWRDGDLDGFGGTTSTRACAAPRGHVAASGDCDDARADVNPAAAEVCDPANVDEDCDGAADDADPSVVGRTAWHRDGDQDGFGGPDVVRACDAPRGTLADGRDCDDARADVNPAAPEVCDAGNVDEDCDGAADDADTFASGTTRFQVDADLDGYGGPRQAFACDPRRGLALTSDDCDDARADVNPGGTEVCDPADVDEDCDGVADDADASATGETTFHLDLDADGYGGPLTTLSCDPHPGIVLDATDCDDRHAAAHPNGTEVCDGLDDDCDGTVDVDAVDARTWYADGDDDGFGRTDAAQRACTAPAGTSLAPGDCDDGRPTVNPAASELCDGVDDDCDGTVDEPDAIDAGTWYRDVDEDGFGDLGTAFKACGRPAGAVLDATDCDDARADTHPDAAERCDGRDDDCDGTVDEPDAIDAGTWFADADADGFGDPARPARACAAPAGTVANRSDCDDAHAVAHPGGTEICDGLDDDCDGTVDQGAVDAPAWFADADADGFGDPTRPALACTAPAGTVADASDCDDGHAVAHPGAVEICDLLDDDCDGAIDEPDAADAPTWYADADADAWGDAGVSTRACEAPVGFAARPGDCVDTDAAWHPGAAESCTDTHDYNCDGSVAYVDADGDGTPACQDCDDTRASVHPGATERCDGLDDDCDGTVDEGAVDAPTWYADVDLDGAGDPAVTRAACDPAPGWSALPGDCDDTDPAFHPGAVEACNDPRDLDCDGTLTWSDGDGDGTAACEDCDDADATVHPGAPERCDGRDDDCDGTIDVGAVDAPTWRPDVDLDGYGDATVGQVGCTGPSDWVLVGGDCDDAAATTSPGATDTPCDGVDQDCSGADAAAPGGCGIDTGDTDVDTGTVDTVIDTSLDTDPGDTLVADTQIADTEVVDTEVVDTQVADTELADTEVDSDAFGGGGDDDLKAGCACDQRGGGLGGLVPLALLALARRRRR